VSTLLSPMRVPPGEAPGLAARDTSSKGGLDRAEAERRMAAAVKQADALQQRLWAERRWSVLLILQGVDAAGKDGAIRHALAGLNPQGLHVASFDVPTEAELAHDFLWRVHARVPPRGMIGVFNRSHYEDVIVPRVDAAALAKQRLPPALIGPGLWAERLADIAAFEAYLGRQGVAIRKVLLHVSAEEQRERLVARLDDAAKQWKFDLADLQGHEQYDSTMAAYEDAIAATSTEAAPWFIVPADHKWFARLCVAEIVLDALEALHPEPPAPPGEATLRAARMRLEAG
jgi:PPK2 family polyphosphate:nucleotide phosphotransferase